MNAGRRPYYKYFSSEAIANVELRERLTRAEPEDGLLGHHSRLTSRNMLQPLPIMSRNAARSKHSVAMLGLLVSKSPVTDE
ncbi:hypothetical protein TrRE_jg1727 [Triparma retinervis]|uniref:Uncharacterized protein n=1 Tax=Triparma retinervis TaxID=2557542 RepID=A0A9W7L4H1_9STRA|nr:hypothetical protein TrRE_jg1727 [Triparma retinervis]